MPSRPPILFLTILALLALAFLGGPLYNMVNGIFIRNDVDINITTDPNPTPDNNPSPSSNPSSTPSASLNPSASPTPAPSVSAKLLDFIFPESEVKISSGDNLELESSKESNEITSWYKEKIRSLGFSVKSFVTTTTNGQVKNSLVGANEDLEVKVEINKASGSSQTIVNITIDTFD